MSVKSFIKKFVPVTYGKLESSQKKQEKELKKELNEIKDMIHQLQTEQSKTERMIMNNERNIVNAAKSEVRVTRELMRGDFARSCKELREFTLQELERRDLWEVLGAEVRRAAGEKKIWVIKCPAPEDESKIRWGDYPFALALEKYLERLGVYVMVDTYQDWGCESFADVVLVLRGCHFYHPDRRNENCTYMMWNISHPEMVTDEEYRLYDIVCVGSRYYAEQLKERLDMPVYPLLQCTDTEVFYPDDTAEKKWEYIFVGNSRGIARECVMWAIEKKLPLRMWGSGWNSILRDHMDLFEAPTIENSEIPALYRSAKATLNDHWKDMLDHQFINNRIFDCLACGLPVITDTCDELREIFPDAVLHYETKEEFMDCVARLNNDYDAIKEKVDAQWDLIQREYSFACRAKQLVEMVDAYDNHDMIS